VNRFWTKFQLMIKWISLRQISVKKDQTIRLRFNLSPELVIEATSTFGSHAQFYQERVCDAIHMSASKFAEPASMLHELHVALS